MNEENELLFRVEWQSKITGHKGHGDWSEDLSAASQAVEWANENYPEINHWLASNIPVKTKTHGK